MTSGDVQKSPRFVYLQVAPLALVLFFFFAIPVALVILVSFFRYQMLVGMVPQFTSKNYVDLLSSPTTWALYLSTVKFTVIVLIITFVLGFWIAYFLVFHVRNLLTAIGLFLVCTVPFWTSNIIRMISWRPVLGKEGLINSGLIKVGIVSHPLDWLLFSDFSVALAFVHLYTMFMIVPIFNSMSRIDRALLEAARDAGASGWQALWNVVVPLSKPGIVIGSIFVITMVMGDYVTIGVMGGQQIASVGKVIQVQLSYLQFPLAAANAVVLLAAVLMVIAAMTRLVDVRREL